MRFAAPSTFILALRLRTSLIGTPPLLPIPLPTSSFPLPLSLPSTSGSESVPEANMSLWKRARFTTPTGGYELGESFVVAAARHIRPALTIADSRRAEDRLIGRLRRERRYFHTLSTTYAEEEAINNLIAQRVAEALAEYETQRNSVVNGDTSNTTGTGPRTVHPTWECTYKDYLNCGPFKFNSTEGVIGLTRWFERTKSVSSISNCTAENQAMPWKTLKQIMTAKYCPRGEIKKLEVELWNLKKAIESANDQMDQKLLGIADRQADNKRKFDNTSRNQQNQQPFRRNNNVAQAYAAGSREKPYRGTKPLAQGHFKNNYLRLGNKNQGNQNQAGNKNAMARGYGLGTAGGNPDANVVTGAQTEAKKPENFKKEDVGGMLIENSKDPEKFR
nr:hypothetical protein [Tanacetum cinerariifolium]